MGLDFNDIGISGLSVLTEPEKHGFDWPEPEPLKKIAAPLPYPITSLPPGIEAAVTEVLAFVQCPASLAASSALSALSLAGQGLADVRRDDRLSGPLSLYFLSIAESGERKTTVDSLLVGGIREWEQAKESEAAPEMAEFKAAHEAWESEKAGLLAQIKEHARSDKDTSTLKTRLVDLQKCEPKGPRYPQVLRGDATPEALAWSLSHRWPSAGVISSEAGIVFGGHANGKDSILRNLSLLNQLWDGISLRIDRRTTESYLVQGVRLTMGLATQRQTIQDFFSSSRGLARGSGFSARFLIAWPETTQGTRFYKSPPPSWPHLSKYQMRLIEMLEETPFPTGDEENGLILPSIELASVAKAAWIDIYNAIESDLAPGRDLSEARDIASKGGDNIARLAALFSLFEGKSDVSATNIERASQIVIWHLYEAKRFLGEILEDREEIMAGKLDQWLLAQNRNTIPKSEILTHGPGPLRKKRILDEALAELLEAGRIRLQKNGKKTSLEINPALLKSTKEDR